MGIVEIKKYEDVISLTKNPDYHIFRFGIRKILLKHESFDESNMIYLFLFFNSNNIVKMCYEMDDHYVYKRENKFLKIDYNFSFFIYEYKNIKSFKFNKISNTLKL